MAEVYAAKTAGIGGFEKWLALKLIHPTLSEDEQFVRMLVEEAKISVLLQHNHIVQTFDLGCIEGSYFIAMELIEGADCSRLAKVLTARKAQMPLDIAAHIMGAVCSALHYAHTRRSPSGEPLRIVHRDVSPQNVLVSYSGDVKLADFGIAKASLRQEETQVGVIKGKYYYMSPEQAWGDPIDARSDVFSAGIVLHELLTGQMVYSAENLPDLLDRVRRADIAAPSGLRPDCPPELDGIVMKALARRPTERFQDAGAMGQALTRFLHAHQPGFTAQRVSNLMGQLFPKEYQGVTGRALPSGDKLLATQPKAKVGRLRPLMQSGEYSPGGGESVLWNGRETRDDLPAVGRAARERRASAVTQRLKSPTARPPRYTSKQAASVPPSAPVADDDAETVMFDRSQMPGDGLDGVPPLSGSGFATDDDEATVIDDLGMATRLREMLDAEVRVSDAPASGSDPDRGVGSTKPPGVGSPNIELSASIARAAEEYERISAPPASPVTPVVDKIPRAPAVPADFSTDPKAHDSMATPHVSSLTPQTERRSIVSEVIRWSLAAIAVALVTYLAMGAYLAGRGPVLSVVSEPPGASVRVNGVPHPGATPLRVEGLEDGETVQLEVVLAGHAPFSTAVQVSEEPREVHALLAPLRRVSVVSEPPGALVECDGEELGATPVDLGERNVGDELNLVVRIEGREPVSQRLVVEAGEGVQTLRVVGQ